MKRFKNILVGVDLSQGDLLVSDELTPPNLDAIERAIWLAKNNGARLTFFSAIDVTTATRRIIEAEAADHGQLFDRASHELAKLVDRASREQLAASQAVVVGHSWLEMIRKTLRDAHDLVLVGSRHHGAVHGMLFGSTSTKLLRKCPCPVWVTQSHGGGPIPSILVAHCLRPVGDRAMELGCSLAQMYDAQLHVVHAVEYPEIDTAWPVHFPDADLAEQIAQAEKHIDRQLAEYQWTKQPQVHLVEDAPDVAVVQLAQEHGIELVTMGTVARTGIAGLITGNTAERILSQIRCSVLAVKPDGFVSPVSVTP